MHILMQPQCLFYRTSDAATGEALSPLAAAVDVGRILHLKWNASPAPVSTVLETVDTEVAPEVLEDHYRLGQGW